MGKAERRRLQGKIVAMLRKDRSWREEIVAILRERLPGLPVTPLAEER